MKRKKSRKWISLSVILSLAVSLLSGIGAVTIPSQAATDYGLSNPTTSGGVTTWDCVWFGNYWQNDTNGDGTANQSDKKQQIKWRVLSVNGDDAFLLADQCLDCKPYNTEDTDVTWETCTLRTWLNQDFYSAAFSSAEQSAVKTTAVVNEDNPEFDTEGGNNTTDKVYLLSLSEVTNPAYGFSTDMLSDSDNARYGKLTEYAKDEGAWFSTSTYFADNSWWWLRSPGDFSEDAAYVCNYGYVRHDGDDVSNCSTGVRPTLHLNLSSSQWSYAGTVSANIGEGSDGENNAEDSEKENSGDKVSEETSSPTAADSKTTKQEEVTSENKTTATKLKTQKITTTKIKAYKAKKLKKKSISFKLKAKTSGNGKLIYSTKKTSKKLRKYIKVSKSGKVTLKKKAKKGTYKILITASKTNKYKKATKVVKIKVK